jgi:hypothetical protein
MAHLTGADLASRSLNVAWKKKQEPHTEFTPSGGVTAASREKSKKAGHTMADGSFPINNAADLARAKHDVGRAHDPAAARRWINKRAKELGEPGLGESKDEKKRSTLYDHPRSKRLREAS